MKCPRCQHENPTTLKFCGECGARLASICSGCGASNAPTQKFCGECGAVLTQGAPAPKFASPETYTPRHLAEKILTSKSALEGERKQVTVLFADLKGSMELLADRDPEEARKLLDPVLEHMMEAVHRYEGTVNQVMGDGIMALFGAPVAHEDHAVRACYAALRMQESVGRYGDQMQRRHGVPVQIRVGLHSGEVVVRSIGNDLHMDYTAVGQTTHLAARMEQTAKPGSVLATADTLRLAEGFVQVTSLGPVPIKGLAEPVEVFELLGAGPARTRWQAAATRGLTRFVGRQRELEALGQALERARAGYGQIVAPVGEPGVGKSRLFWEFTHSHRTQGWLAFETGSAPYAKATPYFPVINLLKTYFEIEPRDDARRIHEKVIGKLLTLDKGFEPTVPAFLALLDVPVEDLAWQALDPPQRRQRTLNAIKRLLLRESQVQPLLLIVEDLHWIDTETQTVLDSLVESLPTVRVLLLLNYRPEYQHGWGSKSYYTQLRIDPLPPENAGELLHALLGSDPGLEPLKQLLIDRTEGNPFFLEESVRTLVETKALMGERGAYRLARDLPSVQVPATVQAVLAARIDRLPPVEKQLLQSASVIGRDVPFVLLQAIADLPEEALRRGLADLQAAEFLYEKNLFPELEYTLKHALTQDVAYGSLLQGRRRALHARIVETIEALYTDRLPEHIERLAHHAFRGEEWGKAVTYLRQAGAKAFARSAHREALAYFEQALTALTHLPETREALQQAIDVRFDLRNSLFPLAEWGRIAGYLREAEILATRLDDQRRLGWVSAYLSSYYQNAGGHATDVRTSAQRVEAIAETLGDVPLQVVAQYYLLLACHLAGDYRGTEHHCRRLMQSLQGEPGRERFGLAALPAVMSGAYLARALAERGAFDEGDAHGQEAIRIGQAFDHPFSIIWACLGLASLNSVRGELSRAVRLLERAVAQCRDWNITYLTPMGMASLGHAYAWSGRIAEGISWLEQALTAYESAGMRLFQSISVVKLGEAYLLADRIDDARTCADRAVLLARERGERGDEAWALRLLAEIASHQDHPEPATAEAHYGAAMALASQLGMRPLVAHCHLGLAKLYQRTGRREQAHEHLGTATRMYREMDMSFWLEKAEAESKTFR
ncbi:MAG: AAA family ATPase [Candidatus Rokubacteria bacterium]|nr:AAA family ATPase [Candidatus Rokubacteria bacterium]